MTLSKKLSEVSKAFAKLPPPISCFANGAVCPWCGSLHETITFGDNLCDGCQKPFGFGYPEGYDGKDPASFVAFPWKEFDALGGRSSLMPDWKPNDALKSHYHQKAEERSHVKSTESNPQ